MVGVRGVLGLGQNSQPLQNNTQHSVYHHQCIIMFLDVCTLVMLMYLSLPVKQSSFAQQQLHNFGVPLF